MCTNIQFTYVNGSLKKVVLLQFHTMCKIDKQLNMYLYIWQTVHPVCKDLPR